MSSNLARLRLAIAMTLFMFIGTPLHAADIVVQPAAGSGFAVKDSTGTQLRLRVDENGNIVMPVLVDGAQQNLPVCVGSSGQIGPCAPGSGGSASSYAAATGLTLTGTTFAVAPTYQLPQSCAANQVPQWNGSAWGCVALPSGGSAFTLPYKGSVADPDVAVSITNTGAGNGIWGTASATATSGIRGVATKSAGLGWGVLGISSANGSAAEPPVDAGTVGLSDVGSGVYGRSGAASGETGAAGVWGDTTKYFGVWGTSVSADGVHGDSRSSSGVFGGSQSGAGVWGESAGFDGLHGHTSSGTASGVAGFGDSNSAGVFGLSQSGNGVFGTSNGGDGVFGHSDSAYGMATDGPTQQARNAGGWVKAMALVDTASHTILRCFNSVATQLGDPSRVPCFMSISAAGTGGVAIDFDFVVNDRFILTSLEGASGTVQLCLSGDCGMVAPGSLLNLYVKDQNGNPMDAKVFVVVF